MDVAYTRAYIADAIRKRARAKGLTLHAVADLAAVSRGHMERVLARRSAPTSDWITRVANALECRPAELLP